MNTNNEEVRYHMLRPGQIVERRKACPAVYIPLGTLEWHGPHLPVGTDTLQAEALAILCAQRGGGLAFPALYFGESRSESLVDANASDHEAVNREMGLPPENFEPDRMPFTPRQQTLNYHNLLLHILAEAQSLGFKVATLVAGHYPLIDFARAAALHHNKTRLLINGKWKHAPMLAWACLDLALVGERFGIADEHAGAWETSHLMHIHPETVDLSKLAPRGQKTTGIYGPMPPQDATAAWGKETMEAAADVAIREVQHRLAHPEMYDGHGMSLREGLWR